MCTQQSNSHRLGTRSIPTTTSETNTWHHANHTLSRIYVKSFMTSLYWKLLNNNTSGSLCIIKQCGVCLHWRLLVDPGIRLVLQVGIGRQVVGMPTGIGWVVEVFSWIKCVTSCYISWCKAVSEFCVRDLLSDVEFHPSGSVLSSPSTLQILL